MGLLVLLAPLLGCAHEVIEISAPEPLVSAAAVPLALTVAVREGSFERSRLNPEGVMRYFADELREAHVFQGVIHPVPAGISPAWELELAAVDGGSEPDSNFYKAALASALLPLAFFIWLENDYTLELEVLLLRERELVATYRAETTIRHRYQLNANRRAMRAEGLEQLARSATLGLLAEIAADAERIEARNERTPARGF